MVKVKKWIVVFLGFMGLAGSSAEQAHAQTKTVTTTTKTRKGWSKRAKGAAIGGGAGAIIGAVAGKGGKGALLGGALGAGAGYVIGNETDKNKSRAPRHAVRKRKVVTEIK